MIKARRLILKGMYNVRDLGGFPTKDGRSTKFGMFLRSEAPCEIPDEDLTSVYEYGVRTAVDLRGSGEKAARPSRLKEVEGIKCYDMPLFNEAAIFDDKQREDSRPGGHGAPPQGGPKGGQGAPPAGGHDWGEQYKQMAEESRQWALDVLELAANCDGAMLYHCTTGKDRTGMLTCYLLSICGVERADIAADYCVSQVFLEPVYAKMRSGAVKLGPPPGGDGEMAGGPMMSDAFFKTPAEAMLTLIDYLTEKYGSVVDYLTLIGVSAETMDKIRAKLID